MPHQHGGHTYAVHSEVDCELVIFMIGHIAQNLLKDNCQPRSSHE